MAGHILLVDDEHDVRVALTRVLTRGGYEVEAVSEAKAALDALEGSSFDLLLTDVSMPGMTGLELLEAVRERSSALPAIVMSGAGTIEFAVKALKLGAYDFIEKPVRAERLIATVESCLRYRQLEGVNEQLRGELGVGQELLGESAAMQELRKIISRIAPTEGRVLILGENGTGKELAAAAVHAGSPRCDKPFVKLNCSAVPRDLVESELFGHEKGAFTGAISSRRGRFELADGGTLFLDEIGDMPAEMQVKLLRVLQEGTFERVGGTRTFAVDVRVVAATNRDLPEMVEQGGFREDLYYRLNVVTLRTPPLRERADDIPLLAEHFLKQTAARNRRRDLRFDPAALAVLKQHAYPGNVRELSNIVERMGILTEGDTIDESTVRAALTSSRARREKSPVSAFRPGAKLSELVRDAERQIVLEAIAFYGNTKSTAARELGVERSHFYKKCKQLGISTDD